MHNTTWKMPCTDEMMLELFEKNTQRYVRHKKRTAYQHHSGVKYFGGSVIIWGRFAASRHVLLAMVEGKMIHMFSKVSYKIISRWLSAS